MFRDKLTSYVLENRKNPQQKPLDLPPRDPVNLEVVDHRRKAAMFRKQGNILMLNASIQESHKMLAQLEREAQVAFRLADEHEAAAEAIIEHRDPYAMKRIMGSEVKLDITEPIEFDVILEHWGRKGMKWGQRIFSKGSKGESSKAERKAAKKAGKMTDQELRQKINRMKMEQEFSNLSAPKKSKGQNAVKEVLAKSSKKAMEKHATALMSMALTNAIRRQIPNYDPKA